MMRVRTAMPGDAVEIASLITLLGYPCTPDEAIERLHAVSAEPDQTLRGEDLPSAGMAAQSRSHIQRTSPVSALGGHRLTSIKPDANSER